MTKLLVQEYLENHSLDELKEEHKIKHRWSTKNPNKFILNYEDLAERGNPIVEECRGLVLGTDYYLKSSPIIGKTEILAFPFRRFYNHGEGAAKEIDWQSAKFFEKLDGTLCIVYWDDFLNKFCVATRNIPDADLPFDPITQKTYSDLFWEAFHETYHDAPPNLWKNMTYMFELCTPENQVVIRHDSYHVFLLGLRNNTTLEESSIDHLDEYLVCPNYKLNEKNVFDFVLSRNGQEHEGIVVCDKSFNRIKIKDPAYGFHNKLKDAAIKSPRRMLELVLMGKSDDVRPLMQERYLNELERIVIRFNDWCKFILEENASINLTTKISRKDFAILSKSRNLPIDVMMTLFVGKSIDDWLSSKKNDDGTFPDAFLDRFLLMIGE